MTTEEKKTSQNVCEQSENKLEYYVPNNRDKEFETSQMKKYANPEDYINRKYPPDECYIMKYKNASHGWIFDDENLDVSQAQKMWITEMKEKYGIPEKPPNISQGVKAQLKYKKAIEAVLKEMEEEEKERNKLNVEKYCSESNEKYGACLSFKRLTDDKEYMDKIKAKYPLYRTPTMTYYRHAYLSQPSGVSSFSIPGMTRPANSNMLWNKYNGYTMPIDLMTKEPPGGL